MSIPFTLFNTPPTISFPSFGMYLTIKLFVLLHKNIFLDVVVVVKTLSSCFFFFFLLQIRNVKPREWNFKFMIFFKYIILILSPIILTPDNVWKLFDKNNKINTSFQTIFFQRLCCFVKYATT